jgi:hypothetical protein
LKEQPLLRDERTISVENSSYRWAYLVLSFGLLIIVAYRGFARQESSWDLLGLVILSGGVTTFYQAIHKILSWRWGVVALVTGVAAAVIAGAIAVLR